MKEFLYNWFAFELSNFRWFRKWIGGEWNKIVIQQLPSMTFWVRGTPHPSLNAKIIQTAIYGEMED